MNKKMMVRVAMYLLGMVLLALGITLNTKTGLGVSAIVSVPYCISDIWNMNFGNVTFMIYTLFVLVQIGIKGRSTKLFDILQIVVSILFTRLLNLFGSLVSFQSENLVINLLLLLTAILLTGTGAAITVNARLISNPADGLVRTIADSVKLEMGLVKNLFDICCIAVSVIISLIVQGRLSGIGIGTILAAAGIGRVIWLYNQLFRRKVEEMSGIEDQS